MSWQGRTGIAVRCVAAGALIALAVPPWGWWPLAFVGVALWDRLLADAPGWARFRRSWLVAAAWLAPAMLWMWDLTEPGYLVAVAVFGAYFGLAGAGVPPSRPARWIALPGALVLAEYAKGSIPFGGVPLANLALTQAGSCAPPCTQLDSPVAQGARLGGWLLVAGLVVVGGAALSAAWSRRTRAALTLAAVLVAVVAVGAVLPAGDPVGDVRIAVVQGGGPQRTRAATSDPEEVFQRHVDATEEGVLGAGAEPVDLILWPENVIKVEGLLEDDEEKMAVLTELAAAADAPLVVGVTEGQGEDGFLNEAVVITPDGEVLDRYNKVRRVPFGEYVPLRSIVESIAQGSGIPGRDAIPGTDPPTVDTPAGPMAVVISWEVFFERRTREGVLAGGEAILNPTNGSSYWLTQVQTQQIASSRLRAIENGRWLAQAAPTGFSALVDDRGNLLARSDVSERWVGVHDLQLREGLTVSTRVGPWLALTVAVGLVAAGWAVEKRRPVAATGPDRAGAPPPGA